MIKEYVNKLIDELPVNVIKKIENKKLDIVLDGGVFNGSYLIGILYFFKELENRKYIKIERLSGCSIGSISALLYLIDGLDMSSEIYNISVNSFKKTYNLVCLNEIIERINKQLPANAYINLTNKLYITYHNIDKRKKIIKSKFKSNEHMMDCIKRSCFIPYLINGEFSKNNKYVDGVLPYVFPLKKCPNKKTLYLDLLGIDKLKYLFSVKNENTNLNRVFNGVLDAHLFIIKQRKTSICSYVEDWWFDDFFSQVIKKQTFEKVVIWIVFLIHIFNKYVPTKIYENNILFKIIKKQIIDSYIIIVENYCF
jgi:hypothetical protein